MICIQNIYYMLAYAFQELRSLGYRDLATEAFENTADLCAAILIRGLCQQIKRGLCRDYVSRTEAVSTLRGRIDMGESIKTRSLLRHQLVCVYDEYSANNTMNQIIKSTVLLLLRANIHKKRKIELRKLMMYFSEVDVIDFNYINWTIQYNKTNQTYRLLISICHLVVKGLLETQFKGTTRLMDFMDEQKMHRLYEKFILEYYRKEYPEFLVRPAQIPWQLDDDMNEMLPIMQSDIMLTHGDKVLIIDAKYYEHSTTVRYNINKLQSANLYQIFTYVKNKEVELLGKSHEVSGMLLYAKTEEDPVLNQEYRMSGNRIGVRSLDLSGEFSEIKLQLNEIAEKYLF